MSRSSHTWRSASSDAWNNGSSRPSTSASASSMSSTTSSSVSSSIHGADEEKVLQLTWTDVLGTVTADVTPEPEPVCLSDGKPILAIDYSPLFAYVVGTYRALRPSMVELVRAPVDVVRAKCYGANAGIATLSRWLMLTGFAIRQCSSHYTVWSDRRELVLNPHAFWASTRQRLALAPFVIPPGANIGEKQAKRMKEEYDTVAMHFHEVTTNWLPDAQALPADAAAALSGAMDDRLTTAENAQCTVKTLWHAIAWELDTIGPIGRLYHKNFQVWHHRKEMIAYALEKMIDVRLLVKQEADKLANVAARESERAALMQSRELFEAELQTRYEVRFSDMDERVITSEVIENVDSKNYHVWTHRGGFVHAFSFLTQGPREDCWRDDWLAFAGAKEVDCETAFHVDEAWPDQNACIGAAPVPSTAPIAEEFDFTAKAINVDCFNNSAWCHRMFLFSHDVAEALLRHYADGLVRDPQAVTSSQKLTLPELLHVLKFICKKEIDYAMQWAYYRPSNECPYTYARGVAELYQSATLRLKLHAAMAAKAAQDGSATRCDVNKYATLLTQELRSPVPAACTGFAHLAEHDEDTARYFTNSSQFVDWTDYLDTFSLLRYQQDVMHTVIVPRVAHYHESMEGILRELAAFADTTDDPEELEAVRQEKLKTLYATGTQHLLDNLHQVLTAMFHSCRSFLEQTWLLYWRADRREEVRQARPSEVYAKEGVSDALLPSEAWSRNVASARGLSEVNMFLEKEAMALALAKRLTMEDPVRTKYWRHEVRTVMHRDY